MASASQDGGPDPPKSTKKRRSVSKAAKKSNSSALVLALDYAAGQSEVFGLEPGEDPRFSTRQKVTLVKPTSLGEKICKPPSSWGQINSKCL